MKLTMKSGLLLAASAAAFLATQPLMAQDLPGEGKTVRFAQNDSLGANYIQDQILIAALEKLGYEVDLQTLGVAAFFQAAAQGDLDITGDINWPQRAPAFHQVEDKLALVGDGTIIGGGTNGFVMDKKTAEANNITNIEQLKDPKLAALFDTDGDGKANLINCDPGWSCGDVVDFQIEEFGLADTVESIRAKYEVLLAETFARARRGEPVLYYTWSPSWVTHALQPGKDVVWMPIPYDALPEGVEAGNGHLVKGVVGCAGDQDPCRMVTGSWNWLIVANKEFLAENPAVQKLAETAEWPLSTWSEWEGALNEGNSNRDIKKAAEDWIAANQQQFDDWVAQAAAAAK